MKNGNLHYEDKRVIIDAAEIDPGKWEIMKMKRNGEEIESFRTRDFAVAETVYNKMVTEHKESETALSGKYLKLSADLARIHAEAVKACESIPDTGTCNLDAVAVYLPRWNADRVQAAARAAGLTCFSWASHGPKKWVFCPRIDGQAYRREQCAEYMTEALKRCGYDAVTYCQMD